MGKVVRWSVAQTQLQLAENEVHVWRAGLDIDSPSVQRLAAYLSPEERARAARFVFETDRVRSIVARGVLRELLGGYLKQPAASICIEAGPRGKPAVRIEVGPRIRFNLSHSHGLALYAFALDHEVGVDVEKIRPQVVFEGIEERYFSAREQQELRTLPHQLRPEGFFLCWTRKEAYIKARGEGLYIPLGSFDVTLTPGEPAVLYSADRERWSMHSLYPRLGFVGALVSEGHQIQLRCWEWRGSGVESRSRSRNSTRRTDWGERLS
jgi:4'-phosphopantetheinyl transferase